MNFYRTLALLSVTSVALWACESDEPGPQPADTVSVMPSAETEPVQDSDDAADDPAIWVNPDDASRSLIIGTNKRRGFVVYDLDGNKVSQRDTGRVNNVDLRTMDIMGEPAVIVAATNRTSRMIDVFRLDPSAGELKDVLSSQIPVELADDPYGLCMYKNADTGAVYIFANDKAGAINQWQLVSGELDTLDARLLRQFSVASQPEGCVADDENGVLYVGEEAVGIWKFEADPNGSAEPLGQVDTTGVENGEGRLHADVEGLALYVPPDGGPDDGYLIASSQGNFTYVVYDRAEPHAYRGTFRVIDNSSGVDGSEETDGLEVTALPVGEKYPDGVLVVQDGYNKTPDGEPENQNFKYISWTAIAEALSLN